MTKQYKQYNERKAQRAINHIKTLNHKITILKRKAGIERLESLVSLMEKSHIAIPCPTCHRAHYISIVEYQIGKYRRQCLPCYDAETHKRDWDTYEKAVKALGADIVAGNLHTDAPRHCLYLCMPQRDYNDKNAR